MLRLRNFDQLFHYLVLNKLKGRSMNISKKNVDL